VTPTAHALSIDVEDFSNSAVLLACGRVVPPTHDVVRLTERMLGLFAETGTHATCFLLGEVAEAYPDLVRRIVAGGHELGVHGWHHHRIFQLERAADRQSLERSKALMEDLSGKQVRGYRAVAMSITRASWWAYDVLAELGFIYSSSIYPFRGRRYGVPDAPVGSHTVRTSSGATLLEIPLSVVRLGPLRLPALGGGYLRHLPLAYSRLALWALEREGRPAVVYLHPYELDDDAHPDSFPLSLTDAEQVAVRRFMRGQIRNRRHTEAKIRGLLAAAPFTSIQEAFGIEIDRTESSR
jgi:polysaccharide deacetylase family protein (PEP-CTERM system associated)